MRTNQHFTIHSRLDTAEHRRLLPCKPLWQNSNPTNPSYWYTHWHELSYIILEGSCCYKCLMALTVCFSPTITTFFGSDLTTMFCSLIFAQQRLNHLWMQTMSWCKFCENIQDMIHGLYQKSIIWLKVFGYLMGYTFSSTYDVQFCSSCKDKW